MSSRKGYISAGRCCEDSEGNVTAEWELRVHYIFHPGCREQLYGDAPHPAEDATIEFDFVEVETFRAGRLVWERTANEDMIEWAEDWLGQHEDEVFADLAAEAERAAEYRAECRKEVL